jgi:hypothetical protein
MTAASDIPFSLESASRNLSMRRGFSIEPAGASGDRRKPGRVIIGILVELSANGSFTVSHATAPPT